MMNDAVERFITQILKCEYCTPQRYAVHEAGHRLLWKVCFPDVRTSYSMKCGLPCVLTENPPPMDLATMDQKTAAGLAHVKLAGIAAEMRLLCIGGAADDISNFIITDINAIRPRLDWEDDRRNHGDISEAISIVSSVAGRRSLAANIPMFLRNCLFVLDAENEAYQAELREATSYFSHRLKRS